MKSMILTDDLDSKDLDLDNVDMQDLEMKDERVPNSRTTWWLSLTTSRLSMLFYQ